MKLKYNILWIEDNADLVEDLIGPQVKIFLNNLGFDAIIDHRLNGEQLDLILKERKYDLILTDLNLGGGFDTGEEVIKHIRDGMILTEVLLYSENVDTLSRIIEGGEQSDTKGTKKKKLIERVSFSIGLDYLERKMEEIISLTIRKVQDVNNLRGLVIAETIDLENTIRGILKNFFEKTGDPALSELKSKLAIQLSEDRFNALQNNLLRYWKTTVEGKAAEHPSIIMLIESEIFTFQHAVNAINTLLKKKLGRIKDRLNRKENPELEPGLKDEITQTEQLKKIFNGFVNDIVDLRNTLAHAKEEINENGIPELKSRKKNGMKITFNDDKYAEIRKNLRRHSDNLNKIQNNLADFYNGN